MEIYKKLAEFHKKIGTLRKDKNNPHFNSTYVDINSVINAIEPLFEALGMTYTQIPVIIEGKDYLETRIIDLDNMAEENILTALSPIVMKDPGNPQHYGSAITYQRRYALLAMLGLRQSDNDGDIAAGHATQTQIQQIAKLVAEKGADVQSLLNHYNVASYSELTHSQAGEAIAMLVKKKKAK